LQLAACDWQRSNLKDFLNMIVELAYKILINCILIGILQTVFLSRFFFERQLAASIQPPAADKERKTS